MNLIKLFVIVTLIPICFTACGKFETQAVSDSRETEFVNAVVVNKDSEAPVITLKGKDPTVITAGQSFTDLGASALDNKDGVVAVTVSGNVITGFSGSYTLIYRAEDSDGNVSQLTREVVVRSAQVIAASVNHAPTISTAELSGVPEVGKSLQLRYIFNDKDKDREGNSIIVWLSSSREYQRGNTKTFIVPQGAEGESIFAKIYPIDNKGKAGLSFTTNTLKVSRGTSTSTNHISEPSVPSEMEPNFLELFHNDYRGSVSKSNLTSSLLPNGKTLYIVNPGYIASSVPAAVNGTSPQYLSTTDWARRVGMKSNEVYALRRMTKKDYVNAKTDMSINQKAGGVVTRANHIYNISTRPGEMNSSPFEGVCKVTTRSESGALFYLNPEVKNHPLSTLSCKIPANTAFYINMQLTPDSYEKCNAQGSICSGYIWSNALLVPRYLGTNGSLNERKYHIQ